MKEIKDINPNEMTDKIFEYVINEIKNGKIKPRVCAKSVCVDAEIVKPEDYGKEHIVWSQGKIEKTLTLKENMVLLTTLDKEGNPVIDKEGHKNVYDLKLEKFIKTYPKQINGHYVKDPYDKGSVMIAISIPENLITEEGLTFLPPAWGGYEGTLVKGGALMFPFDPNRSLEGQIWAWEQEGSKSLDWYPNNEPQTYSNCDKNGTFEDKSLRELFKQDKQFEGYPYNKQNELER